MKYVIINEDTPIIFPEHIDHHKFVEMGKITSAGFCKITKDCLGNYIEIYGKSFSLNIGPTKDDKLWLDMLLCKHNKEE